MKAINLIQVMANRTGITIGSDVAQPILLVTDPDRLIQVLTNLLSNAIKFSDWGAKISITVELPSAENYALFKVKDHGRGIPEEHLESVFERFKQVEASDSRKQGGTGLGLAICRSIVEQLGGQIWVKSELGQGSCFYFTIPLNQQEMNAGDEQ
jgi:signal transduction histidine kinase